MSSDSPASILFDELGNPVGVIQDGVIYRLQTEAKVVSSVLPTGAATDASLITIDTDLKSTQPRDITDRVGRLLGHVNVDNFPATQTISGTVNQGNPNVVASGWPVKITDGYDIVGISTVSSVKALKVDVVQTIGSAGGTSSNFNISFPSMGTAAGFNDGTNMQGAAVFDADTGLGTQYVLGVNLRQSSSGGSIEIGTNTNPLKIDPTGTTIQPISGTITANIGTTNGLALDTSVNGILLTQGSTTSGEKGPLIQGAVTTSAPSYTTAQTSPLSLTTAGLLRVDGSGVTQPISGTVTANAGSGTFTIGGTVTANIGTTNGLALDATLAKLTIAQNTALGSNTQSLIGGSVTTSSPTYTTGNISPISLTTAGALRIDGSAVTQPISGTITANQGGSWTVSVLGTASDNTTNSTAKLPVIAARANTSAPSWTDGYMVPLSVDTAGNLRITGSITATNASIGVDNATAPTSSTQIGGTDGTNLQAVNVFDLDTGAGTQYILGVGLRKAASGGSVELGTSSDPIRTDPTGITTQPINGTVTANIGTTNGLALDTSVNGILLTQGSTTSGEKGPLIQGAVTTSAPSYTTAQTSPLSLTTSGLLRVDGSGVTQPISGTITANIGTTNGLALDTTLTKLTIAQSTALGSNTQTLIGGSVTTAAPSYTTGNINPFSLTTSGLLRVDGSGATQPISGTITANIGTTNGLALDTSVNGILLSQGSTTSGEKGPLIQGAVTTSAPSYTTAQTSPLSLTTSGLLRVDGSGVTQPVSGTITANAGSGTFTIGGTVTANIGTTNGLALDATLTKLTIAQGTALGSNTQTLIGGSVTTTAPSYTTGNINPLSLTTTGLLRVDGSGVTQPVSGTITANAGSGTFTISGTVTANIGTTNGLALDTSVNGILLSQGSTTSGEKGPLIQGAVTTSAPSYTTAQTSPLSLTTSGLLRVDGSGVTQPVSGTITANQGGAPWSTNVTQFGGTNISTGTGASGTGIPRVTVANDSNILATQSGSWTVTSNQGTANSLANAWSVKITDATNGPAAVKAASTAAIATDPALVVAISPNNSLSLTTTDTTNTGNLNALNATVQLATQGENAAGMQLDAGTLIGTIIPEISIDGGTTWVATFFDDPATGNKVSNIVFGSNNTATTRSIIGVGGISHVRVRVSVFTSGTASCHLRASIVQDVTLVSEGAAGSALPPTSLQIGGSVTTAAPSYTNATFNALSLNTAGGLRVDGSGTTQPVSGTITANIGTTNGLALDTSVNGILLSQGSTTSGEKGPLIQGAVTTSAPSYTTAQTSPLSLTTSGLLRVDGSGVTQPISGSITVASGAADATATGSLAALNSAVQIATSGLVGVSMQLAAGTFQGTIVPELSVDGATTWVAAAFYNPTSGAYISNFNFPANNAATTLSIVLSPGVSHARVRVSVATSGSATCNLRASTVREHRLFEAVDLMGRRRNQNSSTILFVDVGENARSGTTNSFLWTTSTSTMTINALELDANGTTTNGAFAILTSTKRFQFYVDAPIRVVFTSQATTVTNSSIDFGFGFPISTGAVTTGAFFKVDSAGAVTANIGNGGGGLSAQSATYSFGVVGVGSSNFHNFIIESMSYGFRFIIEDLKGNKINEVVLSFSAQVGPLFGNDSTHLPIYCRALNSGTAGAGGPLMDSDCISVYEMDVHTNKPYTHQMADIGRSFNIDPGTFAQTAQLAAGAAPTTGTPTNTTVRYTTLGGEYSLNNTASSENLLGVFGYTVPAQYSFHITGIIIPPPVVTTTLASTAQIIEWALMIASSTNPSTATGQRYPLGIHTAASAAVAGTLFTGPLIEPLFDPPIVSHGKIILVLIKVISGTTTGVYRGVITINGYFE